MRSLWIQHLTLDPQLPFVTAARFMVTLTVGTLDCAEKNEVSSERQGTQNGIDKTGALLVFSLRYSMDDRRSGATHEERFRTQSGSSDAPHLTA